MGILLFMVVVLASLGLGLLLGAYRTYVLEHDANQAAFQSPNILPGLPDGFYKGRVSPGFPTKGWQGKVFNASQATGTNQFKNGQRFVFTLYPTTSLRDKHTQVLRIDYKQPGNPWWLGFIIDEIVQTQPGHFLGKVHVQVIPGLVFTLAYFELNKDR